MNQPIRIELFAHLAILQTEDEITRFRTQKTASLLAYLAYYLHRNHGREELAYLLWPEADPEAGRTSLRTALASLRRQIEPPDAAENSILMADRLMVRLNPESIVTDVAEFESAIHRARRSDRAEEKLEILSRAISLY